MSRAAQPEDYVHGQIWLIDVEAAHLERFFEHQSDPVACRLAGFDARPRDVFLAHWIRVLGDPLVVKKT